MFFLLTRTIYYLDIPTITIYKSQCWGAKRPRMFRVRGASMGNNYTIHCKQSARQLYKLSIT